LIFITIMLIINAIECELSISLFKNKKIVV
jgi:hypothetical protein